MAEISFWWLWLAGIAGAIGGRIVWRFLIRKKR